MSASQPDIHSPRFFADIINKRWTYSLSKTHRLPSAIPNTSRLRTSSPFLMSPSPSASPVERHKEYSSPALLSPLSWEARDTIVGPKKNASSSGCAVSSKIRAACNGVGFFSPESPTSKNMLLAFHGVTSTAISTETSTRKMGIRFVGITEDIDARVPWNERQSS